MDMVGRQTIGEWFDRFRDDGYSHMLVVCDTFDGDFYPKGVRFGEDPKDYIHKLGHMQVLKECYNLLVDKDEQLMAKRALNTGPYVELDLQKDD